MYSYAAPSRRGINLDSERTLNVLKKYFPNEFDRAAVISFINAVADENQKAVKGHGLTVNDFGVLCHEIADWDLNTETGKNKCKQFVYEFKASKINKYYYVCDLLYSDIPAKNKWCEDEIFKDTQVTALQAVGLAKEYATVYFNDDIECITRPSGFDDYVTCRSKTLPKWYEFLFDDIIESVDKTIQNSLEESLCKLHGYGYQEPISSMDAHGGIKITMSYCKNVYDAHSCNTISKSAKRFGYITEIRLGKCGFFQEKPIYSKDSLMTAYNIKNDVFYSSSIQIQGSEDLHSMLQTYVANAIAPEVLTSFECNYNPVQIGSIRGNSDTDDVLTCQANGNRIDFVFDDLSESSNLQDKAGKEALSCTIVGGTFTGQRCANLNKEQCATVAKSPVCQDCNVYWDEKNGICTLGNASVLDKLKKGATVSLIVGGAVVAVVITVGTAGAGGVTLSTAAILLVETVGAGIEIANQVEINGIADDFLVESNKCKTASCAEQLIKENLQRLSNIANDMTDAERKAIDDELARLIGLLPTTSQFFIDIVAGESLIDKNHKSMLEADSWEPEQVWRAVGLTLQLTSIFTAVGKWLLTKAGVLGKALPNATSTITRQAKQTGIEVQKALRNGKVVKTSNGKVVTIPDYATPINPGTIDDVAVRQIYENAHEAEQIITNDMVDIASDVGGELSGLEYRMKTPESMTNKIARDRAAGEVADGVSDADVASRFSDLVRYTQTGSTETLSQQITQTLSALEARGYRINKFKNRFDNPVGGYKDIMVQLEHIQTGQKVELQFNTPKNLSIKEEGHKFYEITRDFSKSQAERDAAQKAMEELYKQLEIPKNIEGLSY